MWAPIKLDLRQLCMVAVQEKKGEKDKGGKTNKNSWDHSTVIKKQILQFYNTKY